MLISFYVQLPLLHYLPYLYTAGFLAFSGKPITKDNLERVLRSIGAVPNEEILYIFLSTNVRSDVIYLYCLYYLRVMGKEVNEANMFALLDALGISNDDVAAKSILEMHNKGALP